MTQTTDAIELDNSALGWLKRRNALAMQKAEIELSIKECEENLIGFMGTAEEATINGMPAFTYRSSTRTAFDLETGKRLIPSELMSQCYLTKETKPSLRVIASDLL